jgi:hypothetical protein
VSFNNLLSIFQSPYLFISSNNRFEEGLSLLGVLQAMRREKASWKAALKERPKLTPQKLIDLYSIEYSEEGTIH